MVTTGGYSPGEHFRYHFDAEGYCQCACEDCHLPLTELCVCPHCPCDEPAHPNHVKPFYEEREP